uniref:CW-type domain-containing protein n=1 Tax=Kalanchoe fedtschenkoi TaxID=63787 RepID=A0A7N0SZ63_KALFE
MEESEIEEGEAGTYREENDQEIDPDVAFAYIGEKLHELLGHCQKEFEGCFTAENLGPKFGAYGSFLPTTQRSPPSLHPMPPQLQVQNHLPKSTTVSMALGGSNYFALPSTARQKGQHELGTATGAKLPAVLSTVHDSVYKDANWKLAQVAELNSKSEDAKQLPTIVANMHNSVQKDASITLTHVEGINAESGDSKQSVKLANRKPIRVRITMNSKKLPPQSNEANISSPCPSADLLGTNTTKGKVVSLESQDIIPESPNAIIRSMTASPDPRSSILSPLPEYLTNLTGNEKQQKNFSISGGLRMTEDWPDSLISVKNLKHNKKKPHPTVTESAGDSPAIPQKPMAASRSVEKGNSDFVVSEREPPGPGPNLLVGPANEKQNGTVKKCQNNSYKTSVCDEVRPPLKHGRHLSGLPINEKLTSHEQDVIKISSRAPEGEKRSEDCRGQHMPLPTLSKGNQIVGSSLKSEKMHKASALNNNYSQSENGNVRMGFEKTKYTYKEIFGESSTEEEDNELAYHGTSAECVSKKSEVICKKKTAPIDTSKAPSSSKSPMEPAAFDGSTAAGSGASVPVDTYNADISVAAAPLLILDNWVSCDRCKKWRLLPLYADTSSLPDKWTCRMINWLPGMNHCQISEEDTTKAVHALYELPVPENHMKDDVGLHGVTSGACTSNLEIPGKTFSSVSVPVAKKKKHISTKMPESVDLPCTKLQSKPSKSGMEKMRVQRPKKIFTDGGDTKINLKTENRIESFHVSPRACDVFRTGIIRPEQDQSIYKDYVARKNLKMKNNIVQVPAKRPNAKLPVSSNDSSLEMQIIDDNHLVNKKRKVREHSEAVQQAQISRPSHAAYNHDDHRRKKKARPNQYGLNEFISSEENGRPHIKDGTLIDHKSSKGLGTNLSKANVHDVDPGKRNLGSLKSNATDSSSSKVSGSQKPKTDAEGMQASPVGSVSSSPYCQKKDKYQIRKKSLLRRDDLVDKSLLMKFEDKPLQPADKSISSCTISGSKKDVASGEKRREKRNKLLLHNAIKSCKRETDANNSSESSRHTGHFKSGGLDVKADVFSSDQTLPQQIVDGQCQCRLLAEDNQLDTSSGTVKLPSRTASKDQNDNTMCSSQDAQKSWLGNYLFTASAAATNDNDLRPCLATKSANQKVNQLAIAAPPTPDEHSSKDIGDPNPGPIKKDLPNEASFVEKEARRLKYLADRLGEAASAPERMGIYFESALKFLNAASLYESGSCQTARHDDRNQAVQIYRSTTKLFEFCAAEYEKLNTMCAVSLAYKCMEVACLRVVYSSHCSAGKDRLELQTALRPVPPVDQASLTKGADVSPLATGGLIIPARNRPNLIQFFTFTEDIDLAMDSTQKSQTAFMAAKANSDNTQGISLVKKAIDFNFQDVDEFILLVRVAMEAISSI